jgi:hypothetical protein
MIQQSYCCNLFNDSAQVKNRCGCVFGDAMTCHLGWFLKITPYFIYGVQANALLLEYVRTNVGFQVFSLICRLTYSRNGSLM